MNSLETNDRLQVQNKIEFREKNNIPETWESPVLVMGLKCGEIYYGEGNDLTFVCIICGEHFDEITAYRCHSCVTDGSYKEELARATENNIQIQFDLKTQSQETGVIVDLHISESDISDSVLNVENKKKEESSSKNFAVLEPDKDNVVQLIDLSGLIPSVDPMKLSDSFRIHCRKGFPWKHLDQKMLDLSVEQKKGALLPNPFHESHCRQTNVKTPLNQKSFAAKSKKKKAENTVGPTFVELKKYTKNTTGKETQLNKQVSTKACKDKHTNCSQANNDPKTKPFRCERCHKYFSTEGHLRFHMNKENRCIFQSGQEIFKPHDKNSNSKMPLKCVLTKEYFKKPRKCEICQENFRYLVDLERHVITHGIERPYKCDICLKMFKHRSTLCIHRKRHKNPEN